MHIEGRHFGSRRTQKRGDRARRVLAGLAAVEPKGMDEDVDEEVV